MSALEWAAAAASALGGGAVVLDLGSRLFGSYRRSLAGAAWRVLLVVAAGAVLLAPPCLLWAGWSGAPLLCYLAAPVGLAAVVHMFRPLRLGVARLKAPDRVETAAPLTEDTALVQCSLTLDSLPPELDGLRVLLLSDLHCDTHAGVERLRRSVEAASERGADLALVLGDFGEKAHLLPAAVECVAALRTRLGTFCVRGNHDFERGRDRVLRDLLARTPVHLLDNRSSSAGDLTLIGTEAPWAGAPLRDDPAGSFRIALSHTPDNLFALERAGVDLVVAGHTHGGWLKIPGVGPFAVASRYGALLALGAFRLRRTTLYVTPGFRYYPCAPWRGGEVAELTLRAPSPRGTPLPGHP